MKLIKKISKTKFFLYSLILSFIILLLTSKNSFLYVFNDWVDANAFFTMGKGMMNGLIPYKDLFEQKGLLLYVIYGIGYLFSHNTFHGVFILEVISFSVFIYYAHKIFKMYFDEKYSLILLPILTFLITTSKAFVHGGSCEEFCLPYITISLYYFFKHFKQEKITDQEIYINGLMAGIVFMMKYTMLGFWIGFVLFIFIDYLKNKNIKEFILFCIKFLIGMSIPFIFCLIYLAINGGVKEFIKEYFIINITAYADNSYNIIERLHKMITYYMYLVGKNGIIVTSLIILSPVLILSLKDKNNLKIGLIGIMFIASFFIVWGLVVYNYYILPIEIFMIVSLIGIMSLIQKHIDNIINKKQMYICFISIFIIFVILSYQNANFKEYINYNEDDLFQYKYAKYISQFDNPTLINMGFLDAGLYTITETLPSTKYFEQQNIPYERFHENIDNMKYNIENKNIKFVLYWTYLGENEINKKASYIYDYYDLIYHDKYQIGESLFDTYLFQAKGLKDGSI